MAQSYEAGKKAVFRGLILLAIVTLVEVFFSLLGKGHIIKSFGDMRILGYVIALILIVLSLYKAWFIIFEFMHLRFEVKGLARSILIPTCLLIWAIIAFFMEGKYWLDSRAKIDNFNETAAESMMKPVDNSAETKVLHSDDQH